MEATMTMTMEMMHPVLKSRHPKCDDGNENNTTDARSR